MDPGHPGGSPHAVSTELEPVLATRYRGCSKFGRMSKTPVCGTFGSTRKYQAYVVFTEDSTKGIDDFLNLIA